MLSHHGAADPAEEQDRRATAYIAAHELGLDVRLAAELVGQAQAAHHHGDGDEVEALLARLRRALARFGRDVNHLVTVSGGSLDTVDRSPTNVGQLVERVVRCHPTGEHPVELSAASVLASVDVVKVERIVDNLLTNALFHTPSTCPVRVTVAAVPGGVELVVEDEGPGLPLELREKLFGPDGDSPVMQANGAMGLWIVNRFARLHGGSVSVDEGPHGRGARFTVRLPANAR